VVINPLNVTTDALKRSVQRFVVHVPKPMAAKPFRRSCSMMRGRQGVSSREDAHRLSESTGSPEIFDEPAVPHLVAEYAGSLADERYPYALNWFPAEWKR
jgi:hypothetical protein